MKLLVAIECPAWAGPISSVRLDQARRGAFASALRDIASRLQNAGGDGVENFDRPVGTDGTVLEVSFSFQREPDEEAA